MTRISCPGTADRLAPGTAVACWGLPRSSRDVPLAHVERCGYLVLRGTSSRKLDSPCSPSPGRCWSSASFSTVRLQQLPDFLILASGIMRPFPSRHPPVEYSLQIRRGLPHGSSQQLAPQRRRTVPERPIAGTRTGDFRDHVMLILCTRAYDVCPLIASFLLV